MNTLKKLGLYTFFVAASGSLTLVGAEGIWEKIASIRTTNDLPKLFSKDSANITSASFSVAHQLRDALAAAEVGNQAEARRLLSLARQGMKVLQAERASFGGIDPLAALLSEETLKFVDARVKDAIAAQKQAEVDAPRRVVAVTEEVSAPSEEELEKARKEEAELLNQAETQAQIELAEVEKRRQEEEKERQNRMREVKQQEKEARAKIDQQAAQDMAAASDLQEKEKIARSAAEQAATEFEKVERLKVDELINGVKSVFETPALLQYILTDTAKGYYNQLLADKDKYVNCARQEVFYDSLIGSDWFNGLGEEDQKAILAEKDKIVDCVDESFEARLYLRIFSKVYNKLLELEKIRDKWSSKLPFDKATIASPAQALEDYYYTLKGKTKLGTWWLTAEEKAERAAVWADREKAGQLQREIKAARAIAKKEFEEKKQQAEKAQMGE